MPLRLCNPTPLDEYRHALERRKRSRFQTFIDEVALLFDTIYFSAGKVGMQIECSYDDLKKVIDVNISDITN